MIKKCLICKKTKISGKRKYCPKCAPEGDRRKHKEYYQEHKEERKSYQRRYHKDNREQQLKRMKKYYQEHREELIEYNKKNYQEKKQK